MLWACLLLAIPLVFASAIKCKATIRQERERERECWRGSAGERERRLRGSDGEWERRLRGRAGERVRRVRCNMSKSRVVFAHCSRSRSRRHDATRRCGCQRVLIEFAVAVVCISPFWPLLWLRFALLLRQWHSRSSTRRVSPGRRTIEHATVPRVRCPVCYPTYALVLHTHTQQSRCLLFSFISRSSSHCRRRSQRRSRQRSRFACDHINRRLCKTFSYSFTICRSSTHIAGRASIHPTWLSISEPAQLNCPKRSAESDKRC